MAQLSETYRAAVRQALTGQNASRAALAYGLPKDAIRSVLQGHDPKLSRADDVCRALEFTFLLGSPLNEDESGRTICHLRQDFRPIGRLSAMYGSRSCCHGLPTNGRRPPSANVQALDWRLHHFLIWPVRKVDPSSAVPSSTSNGGFLRIGYNPTQTRKTRPDRWISYPARCEGHGLDRIEYNLGNDIQPVLIAASKPGQHPWSNDPGDNHRPTRDTDFLPSFFRY